jgi:hypothetical protein
MLNIKKIAQKATTFAEIMEGKDKIETRDIIKYHKDGITINAAEKVSIADEKSENGMSTFYVFTYKEDKTKFAFAGFVLNKIFDDILDACEGDIEVFNKALSEGLAVQLSEGKTKDKQQITLVKVL